jgi:aspartyl-tRNA(Asn)/glutamyl-tRNA(Gln) amidotransferase subunit A
MYLSDICTIAANLAGLPAISVPCGVDERGLPVGMQLMAPRFAEATLLKTAYAYEQIARFYDNHKPSI